ncbi:hypothetical protein N9021_01255 [Akkermansiaceae bacterium]|nr:hypothetical protein [Akkermansiaceae bacterium]
MQRAKFWGVGIGLALVFWIGGNFLDHRAWEPAQESESAKSRRTISERTNTDEKETFKKRDFHTSDDLVAIYEKHGMAAAIAAAKGMKRPKRDSQVLFILKYLARVDPEFIAGELKDAGLSPTHQSFVVSSVMREWKDGVSALAWGDSFTGSLRKDAVGTALGILVKTDPAAALAHLEVMPRSGSRSQPQGRLFLAWGTHDPQAALEFLAGGFSEEEKASAISSVLSGWARSHPAEAAARAESSEDEDVLTWSVRSIVSSWKDRSPEEAKAWVDSLPEGEAKERGIETLESVPLRTHCGFGEAQAPDVSWRMKKPSEMETIDFGNWINQDPEGARRHLENSAGGEELSDLAGPMTSKISAKEGPQAAFEWAQGIAGKAGTLAQRTAVVSWSFKEPEKVAKRIESLDPADRPELSGLLVGLWGGQDPAAAATWVAGYDGSEQKDLVVEVLQQWISLDPRGAYTWLGTLPSGESRDQGIDLMFRREVSKDPEALVPWVDLISDPKLRETHQRRLEGELAE